MRGKIGENLTSKMAHFPELPSLDRSDNEDDKPPVVPTRIRSVTRAVPTAEDLGYEDASPDVSNQYDYGDTSPSQKTHTYDGTRMPRRSSLKCSSSFAQRRASIGSASTTLVEVRVRGERFPVHRRRSIDFNSTVEVKEVVPVTEDASCSELWLQPEDFANMKKERRAVVQKHKLGQAAEDEDIRGLEKYLDRSGRILKNRAWDTVLLEQDEQELSGVFNDERIATLYRNTTFRSPEKAAEIALADQEAVRDYLMSPRTTKLMMRRLSC